MRIQLNEDEAKVVKESVASGTYASADEFIREAIRLLEERDRAHASIVERQRRDLIAGIEQADLGESIRFDEEAVEQIKAVARRRFGALRSR